LISSVASVTIVIWVTDEIIKGLPLLKNIDEYGVLVETLHLENGTTPQVGFRAGTKYEKVAVSKKGNLLHLDYDDNDRAVDYKLYLDFVEMSAAG
jgi:hypothetical protein